MTHSMTAFARLEKAESFGSLSWEIRSVNHRFLEPTIRLPESLRDLEPAVREKLRATLTRGKVECSLRLNNEQQNHHFNIDLNLAKDLLLGIQQIKALDTNIAAANPIEILQWPGILIGQERDTQELQQQALQLLEQTLSQLLEHRAREGAELARLIEDRLDLIGQEVTVLRELLPQMLEQQREKILTRCQELQVELEPQRLEQEIVLLAQRSDVAEELDRLQTHLIEVRRSLSSTDAKGRRLDFLMQELNREANTLGSKAIDVRTTQASVNIKVLIEQMREQIQNIE